jgi:hypothetical protein
MLAFFGWFVHYLIVFVVLAGCALLGVFFGKRWSEKKTAEAANAAASSDEK